MPICLHSRRVHALPERLRLGLSSVAAAVAEWFGRLPLGDGDGDASLPAPTGGRQ